MRRFSRLLAVVGSVSPEGQCQPCDGCSVQRGQYGCPDWSRRGYGSCRYLRDERYCGGGGYACYGCYQAGRGRSTLPLAHWRPALLSPASAPVGVATVSPVRAITRHCRFCGAGASPDGFVSPAWYIATSVGQLRFRPSGGVWCRRGVPWVPGPAGKDGLFGVQELAPPDAGYLGDPVGVRLVQEFFRGLGQLGGGNVVFLWGTA